MVSLCIVLLFLFCLFLWFRFHGILHLKLGYKIKERRDKFKVGKTNRGETTKLSIRLTAEARHRIQRAAKNLNLSQAGVILFALSNILKKPPTKSLVLNWENKYVLEPKNLALTINMDLSEKVNLLYDEYNMNKNKYVGLMVSHYFETEVDKELLLTDNDTTPKKIGIMINSELKKKIDSFSDEYYIPLSGLISYSILNKNIDYFPQYNDDVLESFFTRIPAYLVQRVKEESALLHIKESFYVELCLYKAFYSKDKVFY